MRRHQQLRDQPGARQGACSRRSHACCARAAGLSSPTSCWTGRGFRRAWLRTCSRTGRLGSHGAATVLRAARRGRVDRDRGPARRRLPRGGREPDRARVARGWWPGRRSIWPRFRGASAPSRIARASRPRPSAAATPPAAREAPASAGAAQQHVAAGRARRPARPPRPASGASTAPGPRTPRVISVARTRVSRLRTRSGTGTRGPFTNLSKTTMRSAGRTACAVSRRQAAGSGMTARMRCSAAASNAAGLTASRWPSITARCAAADLAPRARASRA